jgi:hypothetical protein
MRSVEVPVGDAAGSPARRARRLAATAAALALAGQLAARNPPSELARRVRFLARASSLDLARRRLAGSSTAFDRSYFVFLESARRTLPRGTAGVLLSLPAPTDAALHLAAYTLAPVPVRLAPAPLPAGWIVAVYGPARPAASGVLRAQTIPGGTLFLPERPPP